MLSGNDFHRRTEKNRKVFRSLWSLSFNLRSGVVHIEMSRANHKVFLCEINKYVHALFTGSYYDIWRRIMRFNTIMRSTYQITHPAQERLVYVLYSVSEQCCRFFVTSHNFRPYPWSLESLTLLQMSLQRQHFLLSCLKTLSVGPAGVWTRALPIELTRRWWKVPRYYYCLLLLITLSQLIPSILKIHDTLRKSDKSLFSV